MIFKLEAIVDIITGKATKQLEDLDARAKKTGNQIENMQKRIDRAGLAAQQKAKRIEELRKEVEKGGAAGERAAKQIEKLDKSMAQSAIRTERLKAELAQLQKSTAGSGGQMDKFAASALRLAGPAVLGALSLVLVKLGTDAIKFGTDMFAAIGKFRAATGAGVAEANRMAGVVVNLRRQVNLSVEELGEIASGVRRAFGDLGPQAEAVTGAFAKFAKVTGGDTVAAARDARNILRDAGLSAGDAAALLDKLTVASQLSGTSADKMLEGLARASPVLQSFGLSLNEQVALMAQFASRGVEANDVTGILVGVMATAADASNDQRRAFSELGIELDRFGRPLGGVKAVLAGFVNALSSGRRDSKAFGDVIKIVGEEDANRLLQGLTGAKEGMNGFLAGVRGAKGASDEAATAMQTLGDKWTLVLRKHFDPSLQGLGAAFTWLAEFAIYAIDKILTSIARIGQALGLMTDELTQSFTNIVGGINDMFEGLLSMVKDVMADILDTVAGTLAKLPKQVRESLPQSLQPEALQTTSMTLRQDSKEGRERGAGALDRVLSGAGGLLNFWTGNSAIDAITRAQERFGNEGGGPEKAVPPVAARALQIASTLAKPDKFDAAPGGNVGGGVKDADEVKRLEFSLARKKALQQISAREELALLKEIHDKHNLTLDEERAKELQIASLRTQIRETERQAALEVKKVNASVTQAKLLDLAEEARKLKLAGLSEVELAQLVATKKADIMREQAQKSAELEAQITGLTKGKLAGDLAALEAEKTAALHGADDKIQVERLYAAKREELMAQYAQRHEETEAEITGLTQNRYAGELQALEAQRVAAVRNADDRVQTERLFAARKKELQYQEWVATQSFQADILRLSHQETQARLLELQLQEADLKKQDRNRVDIEKFVQKQLEQIRVDQYQKDRQVENKTLELKGHGRELSVRGIEDEVRAMRDQRVSETKVQEYLTEQRKRYLREEGDAARSTREEHEKLNAERNNGNSFGVSEAFSNDSSFNWINGFSQSGGSGSQLLSKGGSLFDRDLTKEEGLQRLDKLKPQTETTAEAAKRTKLPGDATAGGAVSTYAQKYGTGGGPLTEEQLANRLAAQGGAKLGAAATAPDLAANADAKLAKNAKSGGASFSAANELSGGGKFAPSKPEGQKLVLSGEVKVTGTLETPDGELADVHGLLDPMAIEARMMGDAIGA